MDHRASDAELTALDEHLTTAIARVYRRMRSERPDGELGDAALAVLATLYRQGPQTLTGLSERERVTPGSMSQTVNRLVELGHAERLPDPSDRRRVLFTLTAAGRELAGEARRRRHAWLRDRLATLTPPERAQLQAAAEVLLQLVDE